MLLTSLYFFGHQLQPVVVTIPTASLAIANFHHLKFKCMMNGS